MDYMVLKGIETSRLMGIGMGEKQLANQCGDGIECSEEEHKLNRRTVFKLNF